MATPVSFRPELVPISGSGVVPIKIKNPVGGLITVVEVDPNETTVGELKQLLHKRNRKFTVERQRYTHKAEDQRHQVILKDRFKLSAYKVGAGDSIVFRDLGVHYPWKTEYRVESLLLLMSYLLFYAFQEAYRPSKEVYGLQKVVMALWILPHALALLETFILPQSKRLAPFALTLKVAIPLSVLAMLTSYFFNGPASHPLPSYITNTPLMYVLVGIICACHLLRFVLHVARPASIPYDYTKEHAVLELLAWTTFFFMLQMYAFGACFVACTFWKHYIYWRIRSDNS